MGRGKWLRPAVHAVVNSTTESVMGFCYSNLKTALSRQNLQNHPS